MTERGMKFSKFTELVARIWSNPTTQRRDCGEEIPERRRELVAGCQRCADCQEELEERGKHLR